MQSSIVVYLSAEAQRNYKQHFLFVISSIINMVALFCLIKETPSESSNDSQISAHDTGNCDRDERLHGHSLRANPTLSRVCLLVYGTAVHSRCTTSHSPERLLHLVHLVGRLHLLLLLLSLPDPHPGKRPAPGGSRVETCTKNMQPKMVKLRQL
ncbi:hypothetical protein PENTCL1PPCAC_30053 [Pristionchus entomophagus]|uniref:G protein-coupled receptor n=1 Tax=Pristionchus entomophagus TaxID=358040 RepID=A0AAV5ULF4_9BILA|nr:hypothetical protein PENTCL1PPCAC_30053 [Pristionchus entomophagus]